MGADKNIVWLASYPKSGNTWFRVLLLNYLSDKEEPVDINQMSDVTIFSSRSIFDKNTPFISSDLTPEEVDNIRPFLYRQLAAESKTRLYFKIHDAFTLNMNNEPVIPLDVTRASLYFVRNPLDVAISFAHHNKCSIDKMIRLMNQREYGFCTKTDKLHNQFRQKLLTWSGHVESWNNLTGVPVKIVWYEDMVQDIKTVFTDILQFIGLDIDEKALHKALKYSNFEELKKQEAQSGFKEKPPGVAAFFRKGIVNDWKSTITKKQIETIVSEHYDMMKAMGYLDQKGNITI